jgi:hypothetical protein
MSAKNGLLVIRVASLAAIWIVAIIPLPSLLLEYGATPLSPDTPLGWFIAILYRSFFLWPVAIGGLSIAALLLPLATAGSAPAAISRPFHPAIKRSPASGSGERSLGHGVGLRNFGTVGLRPIHTTPPMNRERCPC